MVTFLPIEQKCRTILLEKLVAHFLEFSDRDFSSFDITQMVFKISKIFEKTLSIKKLKIDGLSIFNR